ncbi:MAG: ATP-dependent DNA helicase [Candidatus Saccharibacteria bacterium]|nr:ATP-dependent DNA helicase [Candidatus Saccharibacteria bacterium]
MGTYHAFGQDILAQYKNYTADYSRKLDNSIDEIEQFKIVKKIRDGLPGMDILHGDNVKDIISVISDAKAAGLTAEDLATVARQNVEDSVVLSSAISPILEELGPRGKYPDSLDTVYRPIYEILGGYVDVGPILKNVERSIVGMARDLSAAISEAEEISKIKPLTSWKDKYFEKDESGLYRLKDRVANKKLASLAIVMRRYQECLEENGLFDFDDMIQEAISVLKNDAGFRMSLSERYQYIMLDEFQDTNPAQFMIVKCLTDYEKPVVMAVGDDDQAIYEFQGALATNLKDFQEHYKAKVVALTENYRSTQEILDFSSAVIRQAPDRFEPNKKLFARNPKYSDLKESLISRREFLSSDAEFGFVAREIARLVRSGVRQSEIAVISYKTKYFEPLLTYLKEYPEIKIAYEKRDNLLEDVRINQILAISRTVLDIVAGRNVNSAIFEVLSSEFFGIDMIDVVRITGSARREHRSVLEILAEEDKSEIKVVYEFLMDLARRAPHESFDTMSWRIVEKMKIGELTEVEQFTFYENLAALKGKLKRHFGEKTVFLADFVGMVDDYESAEMVLSAISPYRDADEAVQILTAHKAKGLEFEYVFMIAVDDMAWGKGKGNNNLLVLPKNLTQIRHTGTTDGEKLRILYVAMTRAKTHLIMTNSLYDFNGKSPKRLEYLEESVQKDGKTGLEIVESPFLPTGKVVLDYDEGAVQNSAKQGSVADLKSWLRPYVANPNLRAIYKEKLANYKMSATGLTSFIDLAYGGPVEFFNRQVLAVPRGTEDESLVLGTLMHRVFEAVTNRGISDAEATQFFLSELEKEGIEPEIKRKLSDKGPASLKLALEKFGGILRQGKAEVNLERDGITVDGVPILGRIDHLIIDEDAKTIEIYDFKTSPYHKEGWKSHTTLYKYMLQLGFYKLLLNNSSLYKNYTVTHGHILFVVPDGKDGRVYDKVYEFNDADEADLVKLIAAVYKLIISLEFMDKEIFIPATQKATFKDIKEFIGKIIQKA